VMREIQTLRHSEDRRSYSSPASHSVPRTKTLSHNSSENQFELKDNLNSMFSQILNIQKDLSEQKALSSNISLQLQEQSQVILTSLSHQTHKPSSSASEATSEALQDQNEEFYLQQKKYENELEKLTQLLQHKDQNIQKEVIQKNNLQREINELKRETERQQGLLSELERNFTKKKRENEMSKQIVERLEREHGVKQRELMSQIHSTVSQLQGTQEELENYQRNVNELKLNYQNSLLEISVLKREIQNKEKERQEKERQERVREERERHEREGQETQESKAMRDSFENQKIEFQQKISELEKKNLVMEQSAGSLHAEKTRMTQEMMQQQDLINQFRSQALERETLTKSLERKIATLEKEEQIHREAIAEKDRYVGTIQAKFSELELKVLNLTNLI
jgi:chromosome segregation ATPase